MGDGPQLCQMIGEPYNHVLYTECLKCKLRTCPIQKVFTILREIAPEVMKTVDREVK